MKKYALLWAFTMTHLAYSQEQVVFMFSTPHNKDTGAKSDLMDFSDRFQEAYQNRLTLAGWLEDGSMVYLLGTPSVPEAREWIEQIGYKESGSVSIELIPAAIRVNRLCSDNKTLEANYTFIRFDSHITKFNVRNAPQLFKIHDDHLKKIKNTGNVVLEALFANDDGGVLVLRGKVEQEVIYSDPAVVNGFLSPQIYEMRLTGGSPCDN